MPKIFHILSLSLFIALATGCASSLNADRDPLFQPSAVEKFYVVRQPKDQRGIEKLIAAELSLLGKTAVSGDTPSNPEHFDALVTYVDKWWWDITTYMMELQVKIHDPRTNYIIANGHSHRTSLVRKSPESMVKEVLNKIFSTQ